MSVEDYNEPPGYCALCGRGFAYDGSSDVCRPCLEFDGSEEE